MKSDLLRLVSRRCRVFHLAMLFFSLSICFTFLILKGVKLLLKNKNISQPNLVQLPSHLITSENCLCHRSFHIFCTNLFDKNEQDIEMIHIHPAPRNHERDLSRRISTPLKKYHHQYQEDNDQDFIGTSRSEPCHVPIPESQLLEKKVFIILRDT